MILGYISFTESCVLYCQYVIMYTMYTLAVLVDAKFHIASYILSALSINYFESKQVYI